MKLMKKIRSYLTKIKKMLRPKLYLKRNKVEKDNEMKQPFYVDIKEKLKFEFGKYQILIVKTNEYRIIGNFQILFLIPLNILSIYQLVQYFYIMNPYYISLWVAGNIIFTRFNYTFYKHIVSIIDEIYILEDGKHLEIHLLNKFKPLRVDNREIRMINRNDAYYLQRLSGKLMTKFIPLKIKERFYLIPKKMYIHNQKLFSIVLDGNYLDTNNKNI